MRYNAWEASLSGLFIASKKWSIDYRLMASQKCHAVAARGPGDVTAAVVDVGDACSAIGRSPLLQSSEVSGARSREAIMTATVAFARIFLPGLIAPTARIPTSDSVTHRFFVTPFVSTSGTHSMHVRNRTLSTHHSETRSRLRA